MSHASPAPRFLKGALALTLTLGAGSGMFYLYRIAAGADVPVSHRQLHAHSQILGFAALAIMGIAFHVLPRRLGAAAAPRRLESAVLWLMVAGVVLRNLGQPFAFFAPGRAACLASGLLEAAAGTLFTIHVVETVRRRDDAMVPFLRASCTFLLATLALSVVQGAWIAGQRDATLPAHLTEPFNALALHGFLLSWVFGFALRMVPSFLGLPPPKRWTGPVTLTLLSAGVSLSGVTALPALAAAAPVLRDLGAGLVAVSALAYGIGLGVPWRRATVPGRSDDAKSGTAIRLAFGALVLWALLVLGAVAAARLSSFPAQNPWWNDAARHLFTVGFLTLLMVGVGTRLLPVFTGRRLWSPLAARTSWMLVACGAGLRLFQYPGAFWPSWYRAGSVMGVPVVAGLVLFALNLARTMRPQPEAASSGTTLPAYPRGPAAPAAGT